MISYVAGILCALTLTQYIPLSGCIFISLLVVGRWHPGCILYAIAGLLGVLWGACWISWQLQAQLPETLNRSDWQLTGIVTGLPERTDTGFRFDFRVQSARLLSGDHSYQPQKLRLSWYQPDQAVRAGMELQIRARLKRPHGQYNPRGFDYEQWLLARHIDATGYVKSLEVMTRDQAGFWPGLRARVNQQLAQRYSADLTGLLQALTTGTRSALATQQWQLLQQTGTLHLAVISGMHIGLIACVGWWLGRLWGCLPGFQGQRWPPYVLAMLAAFFYLYLSGFGIPAQRAFFMFAVLVLAGWRLRVVDHWTRWWMALAVVLTLSPIAIYNPGFWLSFAVVAVLITLYQAGSAGSRLWRIQLLLLPALMPLTVMFFTGVAWVAPLANLLAIPWISVLVPLLLLDQLLSLLGIALLNPVIAGMAEVSWFFLAWLAQLPGTYQSFPAPGIPVLLVAIAGAGLLILPVGYRYKALALLMLLPLLMPKHGFKATGEYEVWVFDVGQGLAVWVSTRSSSLLYDLGPAYRSGTSAFDWSVLPALQSRNVKTVETLVLSHNDSDHAGGYQAFLQHIEPQTLYASYPLEAREAQHCRTGINWLQDGVQFRFLAGSEGEKDNERSCVLLIDNGRCSLLLTGDIDQSVEAGLMPLAAPLTWMLSSHHGSRYSNGQGFIDRWRPEVVIHSAGYGNPYNHPHPDVLNRFEQVGARQWSTATDGAIHLRATEEKCQTQSLNSQQPRFWR